MAHAGESPAFNYGEFATIRSQAGLNSYRISVKDWVEKTRAVGLRASAGRYGGKVLIGVGPDGKLVETIIPDKPRSSKQQYRITEAGRGPRDHEEGMRGKRA